MPTVYLTKSGLQARVTGARIELDFSKVEEAELNPLGWIPLTDVELVVLDGSVRCSAASVAKLVSESIPVLFLSHKHFPAGMAVPADGLALTISGKQARPKRSTCRMPLGPSPHSPGVDRSPSPLLRAAFVRPQDDGPGLQPGHASLPLPGALPQASIGRGVAPS